MFKGPQNLVADFITLNGWRKWTCLWHFPSLGIASQLPGAFKHACTENPRSGSTSEHTNSKRKKMPFRDLDPQIPHKSMSCIMDNKHLQNTCCVQNTLLVPVINLNPLCLSTGDHPTVVSRSTSAYICQTTASLLTVLHGPCQPGPQRREALGKLGEAIHGWTHGASVPLKFAHKYFCLKHFESLFQSHGTIFWKSLSLICHIYSTIDSSIFLKHSSKPTYLSHYFSEQKMYILHVSE